MRIESLTQKLIKSPFPSLDFLALPVQTKKVNKKLRRKLRKQNKLIRQQNQQLDELKSNQIGVVEASGEELNETLGVISTTTTVINSEIDGEHIIAEISTDDLGEREENDEHDVVNLLEDETDDEEKDSNLTAGKSYVIGTICGLLIVLVIIASLTAYFWFFRKNGWDYGSLDIANRSVTCL